MTLNGTGFVPGVLAASDLAVFDQALSYGLLALGLWWLWRSPVSFFVTMGLLLVWWEAESAGHSPVPWLILAGLYVVRKGGAILRWFARPVAPRSGGGWQR